MRAKDLVERVPVVRRETSALEAARIIASLRVGGVVVVGDDGEPVAVIPGTQLLRLVVPRYVRENPILAHVYDEAGADEVSAGLRERTVGDLLDPDGAYAGDEPVGSAVPSVQPEDTLVEIASVMTNEHSPVVVVRDRAGTSSGVVTLARLLAAILAAAGEDGPAVRRTLSQDLFDLHQQYLDPGAGSDEPRA
jgi:CBS domain-containing protein